jgi:hypothetical protein
MAFVHCESPRSQFIATRYREDPLHNKDELKRLRDFAGLSGMPG